jgi:folate-binding Fe-S cluster repair protein YgfZ
MAYQRELDWLEHSVGVLALSDRAIISINGDDARAWLQGQITNQLEGLDPGDSSYAFVLSLKGRIMADVYALVREDEVWLDVPATQVDTLLERFDRYIIMEDVDLVHREDLHVITAQGPRADKVADGGWPADRVGVGGRQWVVPRAELGPELERFTARSSELDGGWISDQAWNHVHVVRGRPRFGIDFGDWTYPQESGLNPVAPKVLWRWRIDGAEPPDGKTPIMMAGAVVGEITSAVRNSDGIWALGFLRRGHETKGPEGFAVGGAAARAVGPVMEGPGVRHPSV